MGLDFFSLYIYFLKRVKNKIQTGRDTPKIKGMFRI